MKKIIKQQRKDMLKKYEGKLSGPYDHLKEGVDYLDDIQRNKKDDTKFAKELEECSDKGIEISQECKEYYKRKFEGDEGTTVEW